MSRGLPGSVATQPGSHGWGRGGRRNGPSPASPRGGTTRMHGQGAVSSGGGGSPGVAGGPGPAWRTRRDDARCGRALGAEAYPQAQPMRVVQATRHTHEGARLEEACPPQQARRLVEKLACPAPPPPGSGWPRAATAMGRRPRPCGQGRWDDQPKLATQVAAWASTRHACPPSLDRDPGGGPTETPSTLPVNRRLTDH